MSQLVLCCNSSKKSNNKHIKALTLQVPSHEPKHLEYKENKSEIFINKYERIKNSSKLKQLW